MAANIKVLETLYPLADALQIELLYNPELEIISGKNAIVLSLMDALEITTRVEVKASYASKMISAVLVQIKKNLYVYVVYNTKNSDTTVYVLNVKGTKIANCNVSSVNGVHPISVLNMLEPNIVATYTKKTLSSVWERK